MGCFSVDYTPTNSTQGNVLIEAAFPIIIQAFEGDWFDAAMIYRDWVVPNAEWLKKGKMSQRDEIPEWSYNITTWVNTHWQEKNPFNKSGGDPKIVLENMIAISERLSL